MSRQSKHDSYGRNSESSRIKTGVPIGTEYAVNHADFEIGVILLHSARRLRLNALQ